MKTHHERQFFIYADIYYDLILKNQANACKFINTLLCYAVVGDQRGADEAKTLTNQYFLFLELYKNQHHVTICDLVT